MAAEKGASSMGMIGCFCAISDADLEAVVEEPSRFTRLVAGGESLSPAKPSLLGRIFGAKPAAAPASAWSPSSPPEMFDVDKAWEGIDYMLTGIDPEGPLAFILMGGREIPCDTGYGAPHAFNSSEVKEIAAALAKVDERALFEQTDPATLQEEQIYPEIWEEPKEECVGYLRDNLAGLKAFMDRAANGGRAVIVYIG